MKNTVYYKKLYDIQKEKETNLFMCNIIVEKGFLNLSSSDVEDLLHYAKEDRYMSTESVLAVMDDYAKRQSYYINNQELLKLGKSLTHASLSGDGPDLYNSQGKLAAMDGEIVYFARREFDGIRFRSFEGAEPVEFRLTFREVRTGISEN